MTKLTEDQTSELFEAVSELIDDLHNNHDYANNFLANECAVDHGYAHVVTLLKILQQDPGYSKWASHYLKAHEEMVRDVRESEPAA